MIIYTHRHKVGEYMIKRKFALFPVEIDEQRKAWMQYVYRVDKVQHGGSYNTIKYFLTKDEADKFVKNMIEKAAKPDRFGAGKY